MMEPQEWAHGLDQETSRELGSEAEQMAAETNGPQFEMGNRGNEETLDPQDWDAMRVLGHRMVDDMMSYLQSVRERPAWIQPTEEMKTNLKRPLPHEPEAPEHVYEDFLTVVLPYAMGNIHPRFWGWVIGTGTPLGMLADMLASAMNPNSGGGNHGAIHVEMQVLEWCKEMMGFPSTASGLLVTGGSAANQVGLITARNSQAPFDVRRVGLQGQSPKMVFYASQETHSSNLKAMEFMGLGRDSLRLIPVNDEYQINLSELRQAIRDDQDAGNYPTGIIGHAGTVNTGAFDDLPALSEICKENGMWLHVDGAFGALAVLSPKYRYLTEGIDRADSLAFDMHKWMNMPYEVGVVLVRDEELHRRAFSLTPDYLAHTERGIGAGKTWFDDYGLQLSRGFRALKAWMSIKEFGIEKYGRVIEKNIEQAHYLAEMVDRDPLLERLAPAPLNIVCFRYHPEGLDEESLNELNQELLFRLHDGGEVLPSYTVLKGKYALRFANVNQRTQRSDIDLLVREVNRIGSEILKEWNVS